MTDANATSGVTLEDRLTERALEGNPGEFVMRFGFSASLSYECEWMPMGIETGRINFSEFSRELAVSLHLYFKKEIPGQRTEARSRGETANPAPPIVHETDNPTEYITVNYQNGNYEWFEYNFRVRNGTAYLGSKMRVSNPHNGQGWIPPEVEAAIQYHHPDLEVTNRRPPWWE